MKPYRLRLLISLFALPCAAIAGTSPVVKAYVHDAFATATTTTVTLSESPPAAALERVGEGPHFELIFPEVSEGSATGFDDPLHGAARREVARSVFGRLSRILDPEPGSARIRLDSRSPWLDDQTLAIGVPLFRCTDGFQMPIIFDALRNDVHVHNFEGELLVNFDLPISHDITTTPAGQYDLYTLLLHEAVHILGFVGFNVEADGRPTDCGGARMLPALAAHVHGEAGQALWVEELGEIRFAGSPEDLPDSTSALRIQPGSISTTDLRLASGPLRVSGHWLPETFAQRQGVLMLREPFPTGQQRRNLTPETKAVLSHALGYQLTEDPRGLSGAWIDPTLNGQGFTLQFLDQHRFAVFFFGFTDTGVRQWMIGYHDGTGILGKTLDIPLFEASGGRFTHPSPVSITESPWGELELHFTDCLSASATLSGLDGTQSMNLVPLTPMEGLDCY